MPERQTYMFMLWDKGLDYCLWYPYPSPLPSFPLKIYFFCLPLKITYNIAIPEDFHKILVYHWEIRKNYASVNSSPAQCPSWEGGGGGWGVLSAWAVKSPGVGGGEMRANAPSTVNTATFFIDCTVKKCRFKHFNVWFSVSSNVFLCNSTRILIKTWHRDDTHQFMDIKLLTLKLIEHCKVICYE